jgi:hypothetical protein
MSPREDHILTAFAFRDEAVDAVQNSSLPKSIKDELRNAKKYVEGRGVRLEVRTKADVSNVMMLVDIKLAN